MLKKGGIISIVGAGGKTALMFRLARELSKSGDRVLTTTTTKIYMPTRTQSSIVMVSGSAETIAKRAREVLKRNSHISAGSAILHLKNKLKVAQRHRSSTCIVSATVTVHRVFLSEKALR